MNKKFTIFIFIILISNCIYSKTVFQTPGSFCDLGTARHQKFVEKWLNESFEEAVDAIKNGRMVNGKLHKLPDCKIKQILKILKPVSFEYSCNCYGCAQGATYNPGLRGGIPYVIICAPGFMYDEKNKYKGTGLDEPPKVCGCIQGLIVHELVHAADDYTEEGAIDCAKILFPCADDYGPYESSDHCNCKCTPK